MQTLAEYFKLPYDPNDPSIQDWELIVAVGNGNRVMEFLDAYDLFDDIWVKRSLIELVIASYDDGISDYGRDSIIEAKITDLVWRDRVIHAGPVRYWTLYDFPEDPDGFVWPVTPFMREIWHRIYVESCPPMEVCTGEPQAMSDFLRQFAASVFVGPEAFGLLGSFEESVAYLEGYCQGTARLDPEYLLMQEWGAFKRWLFRETGSSPDENPWQAFRMKHETNEAAISAFLNYIYRYYSLQR